ncbi:MAG: GNAT family N-acetyltransferase [Canibacter sp.]
MQLHFRIATDRDYAAIDALVKEAYAYDYGPREADEDELHTAAGRAKSGFLVWAIERETGHGTLELVATITTQTPGEPAIHEDAHSDEFDLRLLAVSPNARRAGIGRAVIEFVIRYAGEHGYPTVFLKTGENMLGAQKLYENMGFTRHIDRQGVWINGVNIFDARSYTYPTGVGVAQ